MQEPALPEDEAERISTLKALRILDTPPEERFDRVTRLAKRLFDVPIALVSLIDENRQWFKSCFGLDARETPRDISFCGHAILGDRIFVIPDASNDPRFSNNPLVTGPPHIRFYAGRPLAAIGGHKLGTLCIIDTEPRRFDGEDQAVLDDLAQMVEQEIAAIRLATIDELTLLSNRRGFVTLAGQALSFCKRVGKSAALLYFDLDGFKQINDRCGHAGGDRVLRDFAGLLLETFRTSDVLGRIGGDEFAVLVTGATESDLRGLQQRLDGSVRARNQAIDNGCDLHFSCGEVLFDPTETAEVEQLMDRADRLMYQQKQGKPPKAR